MYITAQGCCLRNDLYCVECDVKLYYTIPYHKIGTIKQMPRDTRPCGVLHFSGLSRPTSNFSRNVTCCALPTTSVGFSSFMCLSPNFVKIGCVVFSCNEQILANADENTFLLAGGGNYNAQLNVSNTDLNLSGFFKSSSTGVSRRQRSC